MAKKEERKLLEPHYNTLHLPIPDTANIKGNLVNKGDKNQFCCHNSSSLSNREKHRWKGVFYTKNLCLKVYFFLNASSESQNTPDSTLSKVDIATSQYHQWAMLTDHTETAWERESQQKHLRYKSCWDGFSV